MPRDGSFPDRRRFLQSLSKGRYYFRTIKPVPYTLHGVFRAPHIHLAISRNGRRLFTTQLLVNGHPANSRDSLHAIAPRALSSGETRAL